MPPLAGWWRRCFAWWYELLLLIPVVLLVQVLYQVVFQLLTHAPVTAVSANAGLRALNFAVLVTAIFGYFMLCWRRGGQTLAMKTWRLRLDGAAGGRAPWPALVVRFLASSLCYLPCVPLWVLAWHDRAWLPWAWLSSAWLMAPYVWAWLDREGLLLQDRVAGTRIVYVSKTRTG
ncbi:RDD family protein [Jeongeupia wiesaeckerbachi]|uniref:RDD family protein n=1 Tax=Jeongeupia wiesaeckerbachi TaxID=3051218 RepID=UPI003D8072F8